MISQPSHNALTFFSKSGRSWDSYRAVFDSGRRSAILPPPPPPPPLSLPHAATTRPSVSPATTTSETRRAFLLDMCPSWWGVVTDISLRSRLSMRLRRGEAAGRGNWLGALEHEGH